MGGCCPPSTASTREDEAEQYDVTDTSFPPKAAEPHKADARPDEADDFVWDDEEEEEEREEESAEGSLDEPETESNSFIPQSSLGRPWDLMQDRHPVWSFELGPSNWKDYPVDESVALDRYWTVYDRGDKSLYLAKVRLARKDAVVDFKAMTCQVGEGRPRSLKRRMKEAGWLSNRFFFAAFTEALKSAGVAVENRPEEMFNFSFNQDFRGMKDTGREMKRGGKPYKLPIGWMRFAVNVKGQYDAGDNKWLKEDESGWAVAYHGTAKDSLPGILCTGFRVGDRQKFEGTAGRGIYCAPDIDIAQHYSRPMKIQGHYVQIVLQLRVRPSGIRTISDSKATAFERKYWVINNPADIRAYGVLIRELHLKDYIPPEIMVFGRANPVCKKLLEDIRKELDADK